MRVHEHTWRRVGLGLALLLAAAAARGAEAAPVPAVVVVRTPAWSQGDAAREGAAEFVVLLQIAQLRQAHTEGGVVAVGDRRGLFGPGAEEALRLAVLAGVPVVKLAASGHVIPAPHGLFVDGGGMAEADARALLARCLERFGPLPVVGDPAAPEARLAGLRARLQLFQQEFALASAARLASR